MKQKEHDPISLRVAVPLPDVAAREKALARAMIAFENRLPKTAAPRAKAPVWRLVFAGAACAIFGMAFWITRHDQEDSLHAGAQILEQMADVFPGRLEAVIVCDGDVDLRLSSGMILSSEQPVFFSLTRGREVIRVLSYSGREVCLVLGGRKVCLEVLATANNGVIVTGKEFLWSSENPIPLAGYHIQARPLRPSS